MAFRRRRTYKRRPRYVRRARRTFRRKSFRIGRANPHSIRRVLRCQDTFAINPASTEDSFQVRGNGLDDPFLGNGTKDPMLLDQYLSLYLKYRVHASKIVVRYYNSLASMPQTLCVYAQSGSAGPTSYDEASMRQNSKTRMISPENPIKAISTYMSTKNVVSGTAYLDKDYCGTATSNPGTAWYWNVAMQSLDKTTNVTGYVTVDVYYYVTFFDPRATLESPQV